MGCITNNQKIYCFYFHIYIYSLKLVKIKKMDLYLPLFLSIVCSTSLYFCWTSHQFGWSIFPCLLLKKKNKSSQSWLVLNFKHMNRLVKKCPNLQFPWVNLQPPGDLYVFTATQTFLSRTDGSAVAVLIGFDLQLLHGAQ